MATITGLTAARMLMIEAASVISGKVTGDNLILTKFDGSTIIAGNVRGPQGIQGVPGSISVSPAGGSLSGNYPNPGLADGAVTDANVAAANKDGTAGTPSMRTLGNAALSAAAGNHNHADTGWNNFNATGGDAPFGPAMLKVDQAQYRKIGRMVHIRIRKRSSSDINLSDRAGGDFINMNVMGIGSIPNGACPDSGFVNGSCRMGDGSASAVLSYDGRVIWTGGFPKTFQNDTMFHGDFVFLTSS